MGGAIMSPSYKMLDNSKLARAEATVNILAEMSYSFHSQETRQILFFPGFSRHFNPVRARTQQSESM